MQAVQRALALGASPEDRERVISPGVTIRLERTLQQNGLLTGEVVRVQTENIPPEARSHGLVPLGIGGLGHSVVFAYDEVSRVIAIQFDPRGVSLGRFLEYLSVVNQRTSFSYETIVNNDAWERYNRGEPRSLMFSIASPENLPRVEGQVGSVMETTRRLAEIANAAVVTVEVSMGRSQAHNLSKRMVDAIIRSITGGALADSDVRKLSVKSKVEGLQTDEIDFIRDFAKDQDTLDLPSDDHDENAARRTRFIVRSFQDRLDDIRDMYANEG